MMASTNLWLMLGGMAAVLSTLGGAGLFVLRLVIRAELAPIREQVEVLRTAVFNHLSHDEKPNEAEIRRTLGYGRTAR